MQLEQKEKDNLGWDEVLKWDLATLSQALHSRQLSPTELTKVLLERIETVDPNLNSFITIMSEQAMMCAAEAEKSIMQEVIKSPLHGVPIGLKDLIYTKGIRTTMGSRMYKDFLPSYDATVVTKLQQAGAVIVGKLNTHEFAYGTTGDTSFFGPVHNPYNPAKITGGSSSGSGAAVAAHLCYGTLGTDTGGSIRVPASFCGVVGMKPTFGRVSKWGVYPLSPTLDHVGPMTKTVRDNAIMLNVLAGYDEKDPYSVNLEPEDFTQKLEGGLQGYVIGVPSTFFFEQIDDEIAARIEQVLSIYQRLGASVRPVDIEQMDSILQAQRTVLSCEAYATHRFHIDKEGWTTEVKNRLQTGEDLKAFEYLEALEIKKRAIQSFNKVFEQVDVLLTPNTPVLQSDIYEREVEVNQQKMHIFSVLNKLTSPSNLTGLPCISVPCGFSSNGLPLAFQLTGRALNESLLYRIAYAFEQVTVKD